ncbi:hypothetical protein RRG08_028706 [Elysia crispata]|uniref:Uncharacterized protein n=1 Tax=Elysia crispata TaxID=231223 RepID=A0AAE1CJI4_9GAST|nr:hypothetical protein RRG08_028706 [Elysia crispata]
MDQVRFECKPSLLLYLPPRSQLPHTAHPMSPTHLDLLARDPYHSDRAHGRNDVNIFSASQAQKYQDISRDAERLAERKNFSLSGHSVSSLSLSPCGLDKKSPFCSVSMKDNAYNSLDLQVPLDSKSRGSPSPVKDRTMNLGSHRQHMSLLAGHERAQFHPYSGLQHQSSHARTAVEESSYRSPKISVRDELNIITSRASISSPASPQHHFQHQHRNSNNNNSNNNNTKNNNNNNSNSQEHSRVDTHNHSSDSGLNDSGTSAVSLDIDTSDSGVVSGHSAHTINSDDDFAGVSSAAQNDDLPGGVTIASLSDRKSLMEDEEDIRVSSNDDDDDDYDGLKSFDPTLNGDGTGDGTPTAFSAGGSLRIKHDTDERSGSHIGDPKGKAKSSISPS